MSNDNIWILRQNPCRKTNQDVMLEFIKKENIVTCPYGHIVEATTHVDKRNYNVYNEDGTDSNNQDKRFVEDLRIGDIAVIPFNTKKNPSVLIVRIESQCLPSKNFGNMSVIYKDNKVVKVTHPVPPRYLPSPYQIKIFRPAHRKVTILKQVPYNEKLGGYQRSLLKVRSTDMKEWVHNMLQNEES